MSIVGLYIPSTPIPHFSLPLIFSSHLFLWITLWLNTALYALHASTYTLNNWGKTQRWWLFSFIFTTIRCDFHATWKLYYIPKCMLCYCLLYDCFILNLVFLKFSNHLPHFYSELLTLNLNSLRSVWSSLRIELQKDFPLSTICICAYAF